jgi:hypothetical protein
MAQVMNPGLAACCAQSQAAGQLCECLVGESFVDRRADRGDEEPARRRIGAELVAPPGVAGQRPGEGRVQRDEAVAAGLGADDGEQPGLQVGAGPFQADGLAQAQPVAATRPSIV